MCLRDMFDNDYLRYCSTTIAFVTARQRLPSLHSTMLFDNDCLRYILRCCSTTIVFVTFYDAVRQRLSSLHVRQRCDFVTCSTTIAFVTARQRLPSLHSTMLFDNDCLRYMFDNDVPSWHVRQRLPSLLLDNDCLRCILRCCSTTIVFVTFYDAVRQRLSSLHVRQRCDFVTCSTTITFVTARQRLPSLHSTMLFDNDCLRYMFDNDVPSWHVRQRLPSLLLDNDCLRYILRCCRIDRVPTTTLRRRLNLRPLPPVLLQRRLRWFGHAAGRPEEELIHDVLPPAAPSLPNKRKRIGGQLKTWASTIKDDLAGLSGPQVLGLRRWNRYWLAISCDLAQDQRWLEMYLLVRKPVQPVEDESRYKSSQ